MVTRVLKADDVCINVLHDIRVPPQEAVKCFLNIRKVINSGEGEILYDEWGPLCNVNDIAAHHIRPVEAHEFDNPYLRKLPHDQVHPPFFSPGRSYYCLG